MRLMVATAHAIGVGLLVAGCAGSREVRRVRGRVVALQGAPSRGYNASHGRSGTSGERPTLVPDTPQPPTKRTAAETPATPARAIPPQDNLPVRLSGLVGRERKIGEVEILLAQNRLLSLTGAGGSGKTRLALAAAHEVLRGYEGAWFVELAPLSDPDLVPQALATVLSVRPARRSFIPPLLPGCSLSGTLLSRLRSRLRGRLPRSPAC